ncbi:hypothetical protein D3C73_1671550 [compost metagenome]
MYVFYRVVFVKVQQQNFLLTLPLPIYHFINLFDKLGFRQWHLLRVILFFIELLTHTKQPLVTLKVT